MRALVPLAVLLAACVQPQPSGADARRALTRARFETARDGESGHEASPPHAPAGCPACANLLGGGGSGLPAPVGPAILWD